MLQDSFENMLASSTARGRSGQDCVDPGDEAGEFLLLAARFLVVTAQLEERLLGGRQRLLQLVDPATRRIVLLREIVEAAAQFTEQFTESLQRILELHLSLLAGLRATLQLGRAGGELLERLGESRRVLQVLAG
ncbi:hypothetical protein HRbin27_01806 [bacterium HR27]|nr:hypothetical protein HRbin27_01806 [bacterium HR27]